MKRQLTALTIGSIVLVVLAAITLVGIAILGQWGIVLREDTNTTVNSITVATNNSISYISTSYPYITSISGCFNASDATDALNDANFTVFTGTYQQSGRSGFILKDAGAVFVGEAVNCTSVTYKAATTASNNVPYYTAGFTLMALFVGLVVLVMIGYVLIDMVRGYMK